MTETNGNPKGATETVTCAVCHQEIPASTAVSPEGHDYVVYLCGGGCRAKWERERAAAVEQAFEVRSGVKPAD